MRPSTTTLRRFALALLLTTAACGGETAGNSAAAGDSASGLKVALLTQGPVTDQGWYAGGYQGLMMIRDSLGAEVSHQQTATPAEFDEAFRSYGSSGYDVIIAHGSEYTDAAMRAGESFPGAMIIVSGGGKLARNVVPLMFTLEDASYLAGMVAAGMSKSGIIGLVGGAEIPTVESVFLAFEAGAKSINPSIQIAKTYTGSWDDVAAAKEAALAQIRRGADVITHNTDAASFGVFQAVRETVKAGKTTWAIGMNSNQNDVAPDVILGSAEIRIPEAILDVARRWQRGEVGGKSIYITAADGIVGYVPNPALASKVPAELQAKVDSAQARIRRGELKVPSVKFVEGDSTATP
jgi:basic membrane protein A and related proteins